MTSLLAAPRRRGPVLVGGALGVATALAPALAHACLLDLECAPTEWCRVDGALGTCTPKTANGQVVPGGECDGELAERVCASGVCDYVSSLCGVSIGDDCARDAECTGGVCVDETPGDAGAGGSDGGDGAAPAPGGVCRECRATSDCTGKGPLRVCDPSDGRCAACASDADCAGETPVCARATRTCVARSGAADGGGGGPDGGSGAADGGAGSDGGILSDAGAAAEAGSEVGLSVEGGGCGCVVPGTSSGAPLPSSGALALAAVAGAAALGRARTRARAPTQTRR